MSDSWCLDELRAGFGRTASWWARRFVADEGYWAALSLAPVADYNLVLVDRADGGNLGRRAVAEIEGAGVPGMVLLASSGTTEGEGLREQGWVQVATLPFVAGRAEGHTPGELPADSRVHLLDVGDLMAARAVTAAAYGGDLGLGEAIFREEFVGHEHAGLVGVWAEDVLVGCCAAFGGSDFVSAWGMSVLPGQRGTGLGRALVSGGLREMLIRVPGTTLLAIVTPDGARMTPGYSGEVLEHWQVWSRPRWMLARG
jgi:GNAT superfamily N-acetyltransferase